MVYMTHDTDNRGTRHHGGGILLLLAQKLLNHIDLDFLLTDDLILDGDILRLLKTDI